MSTTNDSPVFLVVGAAGGIGSAVVRELEAGGAVVAAAARDADRLAAADFLAAAGRIVCDAADWDAVDAAFEQVVGEQGRLDGVVNCAGSLLLKPAHLTRPQEWATTLESNLGTAFAVTRAAGKHMTAGGSVVLVSSAAARVGLANHEAIAAAKGGVIGLTLSASATYASRGLRFNAVAPGLVETPMTARITKSPAAREASAAMHALGRIGQPAEVARLIAWLLDPVQEWVTGQVIGMDGGLGSVRSRKG